MTNQQDDGGSPVENIVTGLLEEGRNVVTDGLRKLVQRSGQS